MVRFHFDRSLLAAAIAGLVAVPAAAQQQVVRPPIAHYWVDVGTSTMAGMPDMPGMPGGMPSIFGGGGAAGGGNQYGNARGMAFGRWVDLALHTRNKPAGTDGTHAIPAGMQMGPSLPLVPVKPSAPVPSQREPGDEPSREEMQRPTGRILIYWGCGENVRAGQPRVIDLANAAPADFGRAFGGRYVPERGARVAPGYSLWPNEQNRTMVPRDASLVGDHAVSGDGVPPSMRFAIGQAHDLMPAIGLASRGGLADSIALEWPSVPHARAYYLHAFGSVDNDMVMWSSAETPDTGMGLFDYLPNATIDRWVGEKVLLPAATTRCAIPKGIFAGGREQGGGMLRMIAYGSELNLVHPPRPTDPKVPWNQEWTVRVRVKSTTMAGLGQDTERSAERSPSRRRAAERGEPTEPTERSERSEETTSRQDEPRPGIPGIPGAGRAIDAIRGIFGR